LTQSEQKRHSMQTASGPKRRTFRDNYLAVFIGAAALFLSVAPASAQIISNTNPGNFGTKMHRFVADSALYLPTACGVPTDSTWLFSQGFGGKGEKGKLAAVYYDSCGHLMYLWDPALKLWLVAGGGTDSAIANQYGLQINKVGTTRYLMVDTALQATNNRLLQIADSLRNMFVWNIFGDVKYVQYNTLASRPTAPDNAGTLFLAANNGGVYLARDTGWVTIAGPGGGGSDSGFNVLHATLSGVPMLKFVDGSGRRFVLWDTAANNPGAITTKASRQALADSLINLMNTFTTINIVGKGQPGDTTLVSASGSDIAVAAVRDSIGSGQYVKHVVNPDGSWTFYNGAIATSPNYWSRTGTTISTATAGDALSLGGALAQDVTNSASSNFTAHNLTVRNGFATTTVNGFRVAPVINSNAISVNAIVVDATGTPTGTVTGFNGLNISFGPSTNWGTKRGISVTGSGGTNERGFETNIAAGTGNYPIYASGNAPSFFQGAIGINQTAPNASSLLDIVSTSSGVLISRMTTAQMLAIASPASFLMVYNTDSVATGHALMYYDGVNAIWRSVGSGFSAGGSSALPYKALAFGNSSNALTGDTLKIKHDSATLGHTYLNVNKGPMNSGLTSYFYGNSETFGFPTPTTYLPYPQQVSNKLGHTLSNQAISGRTLQNTGWSGATGYILQDTSSISTYNSSSSGFLFNNIGVNDIRANVSGNDSASFRTAYRLWVIAALRKGWPAYRVILISPVFIPNSTFKNDSITYTFTSAASQARAVGFNISVQAVVNEFSLRYVDGYGATFAMNDFYQADSLHMAKFANERVASAVLSVVDSVRMTGQRLAVDGLVTMNNLTLNATPTDISQNTNYPLGLDKTGRVSILTSTQFRRLIVGNNAVYATDSLSDLMASGRIHGAALWLNSYVPVPTTGTGLYMSPYSTGTDFLISNYNWGASSAGRISVNGYGGGTVAIGTLGFPSDATVSLYVPTKTLLGGLLVTNNTLPSGSGMGFQYQSGVAYVGNTGGGHFVSGFGADVFMAKNGTWDSFSDFQANGNSYFTGTVGISQSPVATVRLGIAAGTSLIAPLRLFGAAHTTAFNDGAVNYNTTHRITVDSIGITDSVAYLKDIRQAVAGVSIPTHQQTLTSGSTLTQNNTLSASNFYYRYNLGTGYLGLTDGTNAYGFGLSGTGSGQRFNIGAVSGGFASNNVTINSSGQVGIGVDAATVSSVTTAIGPMVEARSRWGRYDVITGSTTWIANTGNIIYIDATAGNVTLTLDTYVNSVSGTTTGYGQILIIKRLDASANTVTVQAASGETIDGSGNFSLSARQSKTIQAVATYEWQILN
jgi:hypothetical protein